MGNEESAVTPAGVGALLDVQGLTKIFGTLTACDHIDLTVGRGEIHALLGENGAGKSTLVKMLFGSLAPNSGEIAWKGEPARIASPADARRLGIGMVFQHFSLFEALTAAENIALSLASDVPVSEIAEKARKLADSYGLPLDPHAHVGDLSVGERQRIEIIRCLLQEPDLIILDEPTSVLTPQEADKLFETLLRLKGEGKSILYISHRLEEVKQICDRATVLRHGKVVGHCNPHEETAASLARMMVGSNVQEIHRDESAAQTGDVLIDIRNLSQKARTPFSMPLTDIDLSVRAGEVVGIAGVAGNGQGEFFEVVSGEADDALPWWVDALATLFFVAFSAVVIALATSPGFIRFALLAGLVVLGAVWLRSTWRRRRRRGNVAAIQMRGNAVDELGISGRRLLGAGFVPEERLGHGAVPGMALSDNMLLARHKSDRKAFLSGGPLGIVNRSAVEATTKRVVAEMDVRKSSEDPEASALSGGNLQKFIVGRELDRKPAVLVVNQPTWGVDAGAAARIRQALIDLAREGSAVIVISQDLDELFEIADRIAVMAHGHMSETIPIAEATRERIGLLMGGSQPERAVA